MVPKAYVWRMSTKPKRRPAFLAIRAHLENDIKMRNRSIIGKCLTRKRQLLSAVDTWIKWTLWSIFTALRVSLVPSHQEIVTYGRLLGREYINDHLRKEGLMCQNRLPVPATDVSRQLKRVCTELVKCYPGLYKDVSKQLNITLTMETSVGEIFVSIISELFKNGISWAKIVAMFCIAASLSQNCLQHGNGLAINEIVQSMTQFIDNKLAIWIAQHGGWVDFNRHFLNHHETDAILIMMVVTCASVAFVMIGFTDILA